MAAVQGMDIFIGVEDQELIALVTRCLEEQPLFRVRGIVGNAEDLGEALGRTNPHFVFLSDRVAEEIGRLPAPEGLLKSLRSAMVFLVGSDTLPCGDHPLLQAAGRLGFPCDGRALFQQLSRQAGERSEAALRWLNRHRQQGPGERPEGPRAFLLQGAKGGTGTTFLAARLAAFAAQHRDTLLIDFDLHSAALSNLFDAPFRRCLTDLIPLGGEITSAALESVVRRHPSGFKLLPAPPEAERPNFQTKAGLSEALQAIFLRQDLTIVDIPRGLDEVSACLHVLCHRSLLIFTPDVLAVRALERDLSLLRRLSLGGERLGLVLNRISPHSSIGAAQVEAYLRLPVIAAFREDPAAGVEFAELGKIPTSVPSLRETAALAGAIGLPAEVPGRERSRRGRRALFDPAEPGRPGGPTFE